MMARPRETFRTAPARCRSFGWARFWRCESGSQTIEAVIWVPIFAFLLAFTMNVALVFFNESQVLRVVQDANRFFSVGRFTTSEETQTYITDNLAYLSANLSVDTVVDNGLITTSLTIPTIDMMPMQILGSHYFEDARINVVAQHVVEY